MASTQANRSVERPVFPVGDPRRGNFVPDCDLFTMAANGECGAGPANFGQLSSVTAFNPETRFGWGNRPWNAEFSTSVQHELMPRVSMDVGYFRRWYGNFLVIDNRANTAADFDPYSITGAASIRACRTAAATRSSGLYNLNPASSAWWTTTRRFASDFGKQTETWNGVDLSVNARLQNGLMVQGGFNTGRTIDRQLRGGGEGRHDDGRLRARAHRQPDAALLPQRQQLAAPDQGAGDLRGAADRHEPGGDAAEQPDVNAGMGIIANYIATNAAVQPSLGRPLSGGAANATVNLVEPNTLYGDRVNQLDVRLGKTLAVRRDRRVLVNFDISNVLNSSVELQYEQQLRGVADAAAHHGRRGCSSSAASSTSEV